MPRTRGGAAVTTPRRRRVTPRQYRAAFAARVRQARTTARYPVDEMALLLGITRDPYNKYEGQDDLRAVVADKVRGRDEKRPCRTGEPIELLNRNGEGK